MNTFRAVDAMEYVEAYHNGVGMTRAGHGHEDNTNWVQAQLAKMTKEIEKSLAEGKEIPTYIIAAYRGYEDAEDFLLHGHVPNVISLDLDPKHIRRVR